jgi:prepilin-type N-terminal cleavage/methylation domain-containing protein
MKSNLDNDKSTIGFTLVELLVVIAVIVLLLALLMPAMDKAIYQAELAVCAANHRAVANGALMYAGDFQRTYPYRLGHGRSTTLGNQPHVLKNPDTRLPIDDRPMYRNYFALKTVVCPLTKKIDLSIEANDEDTSVWGTYYLWFGFRYTLGNENGMFRLGDRLNWRGRSFRVLTAPVDIIWDQQLIANNSHPDWKTGVMTNYSRQNEATPIDVGNPVGSAIASTRKNTLSLWSVSNSSYDDPGTPARDVRGPIDANYSFDDASVLRLDNVVHDDKRLVPVPGWASGMGFDSPSDRAHTQLPPTN